MQALPWPIAPRSAHLIMSLVLSSTVRRDRASDCDTAATSSKAAQVLDGGRLDAVELRFLPRAVPHATFRIRFRPDWSPSACGHDRASGRRTGVCLPANTRYGRTCMRSTDKAVATVA